MNKSESQFIDKILLRDRVIEVGKDVYISSINWKGQYPVKEIQICESGGVLVWCLVKKRLVPFNEEEIFESR